MSLDFLVWLVAFFIQLGLLGVTMYIVSLSASSTSMKSRLHSATRRPIQVIVMTRPLCYSQLITLSDLEADYLNPHDSSVIVNYWLVRTSSFADLLLTDSTLLRD